jgi:hypothetical protein
MGHGGPHAIPLMHSGAGMGHARETAKGKAVP